MHMEHWIPTGHSPPQDPQDHTYGQMPGKVWLPLATGLNITLTYIYFFYTSFRRTGGPKCGTRYRHFPSHNRARLTYASRVHSWKNRHWGIKDKLSSWFGCIRHDSAPAARASSTLHSVIHARVERMLVTLNTPELHSLFPSLFHQHLPQLTVSKVLVNTVPAGMEVDSGGDEQRLLWFQYNPVWRNSIT